MINLTVLYNHVSIIKSKKKTEILDLGILLDIALAVSDHAMLRLDWNPGLHSIGVSILCTFIDNVIADFYIVIFFITNCLCYGIYK